MSKRVLVVRSSLRLEQGASNRMVDRFVAGWAERRPTDRIEQLDLAAEPLPHLDRATFASFAVPPADRTPEQQALAARSDGLIAQLLAAEVLVLGVPMYNKFVPSTFKSWIDHVARAGQTFRYTVNGSVGLLPDRPTYVLTSRGGLYRNTPGDQHTLWLQQIFALMGVNDLHFVYAEGLSISPEMAASSMAQAERDIDALLATVPAV